MPTTKHRHMVSETDEVHAALEVARAAWPEEHSTSRLLARLIVVGRDHLLEDPQRQQELHRQAWSSIRERFPWQQGPEYLEALRAEDWPE
jgi:hypothetical protein